MSESNGNDNKEKTPLELGKYKLLRDKSLKIDGDILEKEIQSLRVVREFSSHSTLNLVLYRNDNEDFDKLGSVIEILCSSYNGENYSEDKTVFLGIITEFSRERNQIKITAKSMSILLDKGKQYQSYQNYLPEEIGIYDEIKKNFLEKNKDTKFEIALKKRKDNKGKNKENVKPFFIQYGESHWEFFKRVASNAGIPVINRDIYENSKEIKIDLLIGYFDLDANSKKGTLDLIESPVIHSLIKKENKSYHKLCFNGLLSPGDYINIKDSEGDYIISKAVIYYNKINSSQDLEFEYLVHKRETFKIKQIINPNIAGKSLIGKVNALGLDKNLGKITLDFKFGDEFEEKGGGGYSFINCSTNYSGNKSGEFFMPDKDDLVSVYFPNGYETSGFVNGAVREVLDQNYHDVNKKSLLVGNAEKSSGIILSREDRHVKIAGNNANTGKDSSVYIKVKENGISIKGDNNNVEITLDKDIIILKNKNAKISIHNDVISMQAGDKSKLEMNGSKVTIASGNSKINLTDSAVNIQAQKYSAK